MSVNLGKAKKILTETFVEDCKDMTEDHAKDMIIESTMKIKELEEEKTQDDQLNAAKSVVKDLSAGYNSAIKYEKAKVQFLIDRVKEIKGEE